MMKATMTTWMMKTPLPKPKTIPILPTHKWEDGATARDCPMGVEVFLLLFLLLHP